MQRWNLAALRNQRFTSLSELNAAIRVLVVKRITRLTRKLKTTRSMLFETVESPALRPQPTWKLS